MKMNCLYQKHDPGLYLAVHLINISPPTLRNCLTVRIAELNTIIDPRGGLIAWHSAIHYAITKPQDKLLYVFSKSIAYTIS